MDTKLVIPVTDDSSVIPKPKIALSLPYPHAAKSGLAVPTPETSDATTPTLDTILVTAVSLGSSP